MRRASSMHHGPSVPSATRLKFVWFAVAVVAAYGQTGWAAADCTNWNTEAFFKSAGSAHVRTCVASGASLERRDRSGRTPLHVAAEFGNAEQVVAILELGAGIGSKDENGATPLHSAARNRTAATVAALVRAGAEVDAADERGMTPLHIAARYGAAESMEVLLASGANIEVLSDSVGTPLHAAVWVRGTVPVSILLRAGADPNSVDSDGKTPLHLAADRGRSAEMVRALLEAGADPNARDGDEASPLSYVSGQDDLEKTVALLDNGADPNARSFTGRTPLHSSAANGNPKVIAALVEAGADVNARDDFGQSPWMAAKQSEIVTRELAEQYGIDLDYSETFEALVRAGAKREAADADTLLPFNFFTEVQVALKEAGPGSVEQMHPADCGQWTEGIFFTFASPADIARYIDEGSSTDRALHSASKWGGPEHIEGLLKAGGNVKERNLSGQTPLHAAVEAMHPVLAMFTAAVTQGSPPSEWHQTRVSANVAALLEAGADIEARNDGGQTPLHTAAMSATSIDPFEDALHILGSGGEEENAMREARALAATVALLAAGADVNARDNNGWTPLHWAAAQDTPEIIAAILDAGMPVDPVDADGRTPLHLAAGEKGTANLATLLDAGAAIDARNQSGETPLHLASMQATSSEIAVLLAAGAAVDVRNRSGETPLHLAARGGTTSEIETLIKAGADPDAKDHAGRTPMFAAVVRTTVEPVAVLIEGGASVEVRDAHGWTPLHEAPRCCGPAEILEMILAAGADPDAMDNYGATPIFFAFYPAEVSILVEAGASVNMRDVQGRTALHGKAQWADSPEIIEALLDAGVDPSVRDNQGKLARDLAEGREERKGTEAYRRLMTQ